MADKQVLVSRGSGYLTSSTGVTSVDDVKVQFDEATPMAYVVALIEEAKARVIEYYTKR